MALNDYVTTEVEDGRLMRLVIRNGWQDKGDAEALSQAITASIDAALTADEPVEEPLPSTRRELSLRELQEYMGMHNEWRQKARALRRRIDAGEFIPEDRPELVDPQERVFVEFAMGRFRAVHLHPEWAAGASLQGISDAVLNLLDGVDLVRADPAAAEKAELRALDRRIREFAS